MRSKFNESCIYLRNIHTTYKFTTTKRCSPHKRTRITKHRKHLNQPKRLLTTIPSRRDVCAMCRCRCCCCRCCCRRLLSPLLPPPPHINISLCLHFIHGMYTFTFAWAWETQCMEYSVFICQRPPSIHTCSHYSILKKPLCLKYLLPKIFKSFHGIVNEIYSKIEID